MASSTPDCVHETTGSGGTVTSAKQSRTDSFGKPHAKAVTSLPCTTAWTVERRCRRTKKPSFALCLRELCRRTRIQTCVPASGGSRSPTSVHFRDVVPWLCMLSCPNSCFSKSRRVTVGTSGPSSFFLSASSRSLRLRSFSSSFLRFSSAFAAFFASLSAALLPPPSPPDGAAGAPPAAAAGAAEEAAPPDSPWKPRTSFHCFASAAIDGSAAAASALGHVGPPAAAAEESCEAIHSKGFAGVS